MITKKERKAKSGHPPSIKYSVSNSSNLGKSNQKQVLTVAGAVMCVSEELLCSFELLKPLDASALKQHMKKGDSKKQ